MLELGAKFMLPPEAPLAKAASMTSPPLAFGEAATLCVFIDTAVLVGPPASNIEPPPALAPVI